MKEHLLLLGLALIGCYGWGYSFGLRRANKDYKPAIDRALSDYRYAASRHEKSIRKIEKLRNRLQARRILEMKREADSASTQHNVTGESK